MSESKPRTGLRVGILLAGAALFALVAWKLGIGLPSPDSIRQTFDKWQADPKVGPNLVPFYLGFIFFFGIFGFPRGVVAAIGIGLMGEVKTWLAFSLILPVSALIQFMVIRWAIAAWVRDRLPAQAVQWEERILKHGFWAVALLRGFPPTAMGMFNSVCAVSALRPQIFFLGSLAGYFISSLFYVILAGFLLELYLRVWDSEWAMPIVVAIIIVTIGAMYTVYGQLKKQGKKKG